MSDKAGNFGLAIAFVAPGAIVLWGVALYSPTIQDWFGIAARSQTSVGGFLFVLLAALATGVFISGLRWALIDRLMAWLGLERPDFDFELLKDRPTKEAFEFVNEQLYRYYQFYANTFVAILIAYGLWLGKHGWDSASWVSFVLVGVADVILLMSAHNSLKRFYKEGERLLSTPGGGRK